MNFGARPFTEEEAKDLSADMSMVSYEGAAESEQGPVVLFILFEASEEPRRFFAIVSRESEDDPREPSPLVLDRVVTVQGALDEESNGAVLSLCRRGYEEIFQVSRGEKLSVELVTQEEDGEDEQ